MAPPRQTRFVSMYAQKVDDRYEGKAATFPPRPSLSKNWPRMSPHPGPSYILIRLPRTTRLYTPPGGFHPTNRIPAAWEKLPRSFGMSSARSAGVSFSPSWATARVTSLFPRKGPSKLRPEVPEINQPQGHLPASRDCRVPACVRLSGTAPRLICGRPPFVQFHFPRSRGL